MVNIKKRTGVTMDVKISYSNFLTSNNIIDDLMRIESDVYLSDYCGEYSSIEGRFNKFKDMFVLAYDGSTIIGYLCYFPISKRLHDDLLLKEGFHDDDIMPDDVKTLTESNNIYLLSIALYKKYQGQGIGRMMFEAFESKIREEKMKGCVIEDVIASVVTKQGESLLKKGGFKLVNDYTDTEKYKLYKKDGNEI